MRMCVPIYFDSKPFVLTLWTTVKVMDRNAVRIKIKGILKQIVMLQSVVFFEIIKVFKIFSTSTDIVLGATRNDIVQCMRF